MNHKLIYFLCLLLISNASASELAMAIAAYEQGDYQTAYEEPSRLAKNDDAEAQYNLAFMYFGGNGISQDDTKAAQWFERAAKSGHAAAQDKLAYMYLHGRGLTPDRIRAYAWYSLAAHNGIFLAKKISENLRKRMSSSERADAEHLSHEYIKIFKK